MHQHLLFAIVILATAFTFLEVNKTQNKIYERINETQNNIIEQINNVSREVQNLTFIFKNKQAILKAELSTGMVYVTPASKSGNAYACGTLIFVNGKFYYLTNAHVVFDTDTNKTREIINIILYDGSHLNFTDTIIMFNGKNSADIALIEVYPTIAQRLHAVVPLNQDNYLGQKLISISLHEITPIFDECNVVEIPNCTFIQTNCGGIHGSSGTGYFEPSGYLVAVHKGQGTLYDEIYKPQKQRELKETAESANMTESEIEKKFSNAFRSLVTEKLKEKANLSKDTNVTNITDFIYNNVKNIIDLSINNLTNTTASIIKTFQSDDTEISYFPIDNNEQNTKNSLCTLIKQTILASTEISLKALNRRMTAEDIFNIEYSKIMSDIVEEVRQNFVVEMKTFSRNPRAQAVCTKYIYELLKNETSNSIRLKFKEEYELK